MKAKTVKEQSVTESVTEGLTDEQAIEKVDTDEQVDAESKLEDESTLTVETVVYCGPTIRNLIQAGDAYNNGLPKKVSELADKNRAVKRLIVPLGKLVETKANLSKPGSIESLSYKEILETEVR